MASQSSKTNMCKTMYTSHTIRVIITAPGASGETILLPFKISTITDDFDNIYIHPTNLCYQSYQLIVKCHFTNPP